MHYGLGIGIKKIMGKTTLEIKSTLFDNHTCALLPLNLNLNLNLRYIYQILKNLKLTTFNSTSLLMSLDWQATEITPSSQVKDAATSTELSFI